MVSFPPVPEGEEHLATVSYFPGVTGSGRAAQIGRRGGAPEGVAAGVTGSRASRVAVHQLARRGMSRWELEQVLRKREVDADAAAAELDRLESVGLLDDAALALTLVFTLHTRRGFGRAAIAQELAKRHIAAEVVSEALAEIEDEDELERALELALKRVPQLASCDDPTAERRLGGFLARKGYDSQTVRAVVTEAMRTRAPHVD